MAKQISIQFDDFSFDPPQKEQPAADHTAVASNDPEILKQKLGRKPGGRRSLKGPLMKDVVLPPDEELFARAYYPIGEVAKMFGEQTSLIRYWDNEFKILKPKKNRKGDRYFRPEDVKALQLIHHLLRVRKFTIEGAKDFMKNEKAASEKLELIGSLEKLKLFLQQLKDNI